MIEIAKNEEVRRINGMKFWFKNKPKDVPVEDDLMGRIESVTERLESLALNIKEALQETTKDGSK